MALPLKYYPLGNFLVMRSQSPKSIYFECVVLCFQVSYGDEKFPPSEEGPIVATPTTELLGRAKEIAQVCVCKGGAGSR